MVAPLQHPREQLVASGVVVHEPKPVDAIEPYKLLACSGRGVFVYDPRAPLGRRTVQGKYFQDAGEAEAFARALLAGGAT